MNRGFSLVSMMVTIVLIGILAAAFLTGGFGLNGPTMKDRPDNVGETVIGKSAARAKDEVCRNNLSQLRMAIRMEMDQDSTPQALADVPGLGASFKKCPIRPNEEYIYDATTGQVNCPHPGHERY